MKILALFSLVAALVTFGSFAYSSDDHKEGEHKEDDHGHEEGEKQAHTEGDSHDEHEEEASSTVGPDKGITEKAEAGFKLSAEAMKTMEIKSVPYAGGSISLPAKAIVQIKDEKSVFRIRDGWIKRTSVQVLQKNPDSLVISSKGFRDADQVVVEGAGFLRISEIFSEEGASHGHSH
jgi:hypothetical protein